MTNKYPNLLSPITLAGVTFRNRIFSAPMGGTDITPDCCIGPKTTKFYELRAKGGAAAVTVSECVVHETDGSHMFRLNLSTPGSLPSFTYTADAIRRHGCMPSVELSHSGQFGGTYLADKNKQHSLVQWGTSARVREDDVEVKELTKDLIDDIVRSYGETAALAKRAGFEMVMIHGGHGWLINQFLSPLFNHRSDEYGGSFENRVRFAVEVVKSVREAVGPKFPIEFRMSGDEFVDGGYHLDEGIKIAQAVEDYVDLIHVSAGTYQKTFGITHPSWFEPHGRNVYLAAEIKKHVNKPVATIGGLNDPEMLEEIIASGKADVVEMARALLADPQLPNKITEGREEEIVRCLRCYTCMAERAATFTRRCTVNPLIGREDEGLGEIMPAPVKRKVLVVGGGPGGLYAAYTAARRGHQVILCEASAEIGGLLKGEEALPPKFEMFQLGGTYATLARKAGVEIRLNTRVDADYVKKEAPDALIVAAGSSPMVPPIPGLRESSRMIVAEDYYLKKDQVGENVVVLGGGLVGCELAAVLGDQGKKVHVVEMRDELCPDANVRYRPLLMNKMKEVGIQVHTGCTCKNITDDKVIGETKDGEQVEIHADSILCALGLKPNTDIVEELRGLAPQFASIGNCVRPNTITYAVYQGYHAALDIH
ncbi:MAG: FAD-dependent oxidoreductase [Eubacterium sp.]|jgi:2,4-dienoyl-CoA reductase-like NADH-dependent reductase (Old Yellow Enzyme family)/thioredoxin reductase|nr:FAD-dependent oxidoreductase [Eubacterium sp.]MCI2197620.1 FAD-dependent oxidoreductase [Eubacterium sp.]